MWRDVAGNVVAPSSLGSPSPLWRHTAQDSQDQTRVWISNRERLFSSGKGWVYCSAPRRNDKLWEDDHSSIFEEKCFLRLTPSPSAIMQQKEHDPWVLVACNVPPVFAFGCSQVSPSTLLFDIGSECVNILSIELGKSECSCHAPIWSRTIFRSGELIMVAVIAARETVKFPLEGCIV